jgi:hypothetical protein
MENDFKNLILQKRESKLDKIHLYDDINMNKLDKLLISNLLLQKFNYKYLNKIYENEHKQLTAYKNLIRENQPVIYYKSNHYDAIGRVPPLYGLGLINLRREIRHTLIKDKYTDIDIDNCHPIILQQILDYNNISNEEFKYYINNREDVLNIIKDNHKINRDDAKNLMISIMYGRNYK